MSPSPALTFGPVAYDEERLIAKLRGDPILYNGLRELLLRRRENRREQAESADGEKAAVLRGRCQELTALLNDTFQSSRDEPRRLNPSKAMEGDY